LTNKDEYNILDRSVHGGIFSDSVIANFILILTVKEFWKSVNIWWT